MVAVTRPKIAVYAVWTSNSRNIFAVLLYCSFQEKYRTAGRWCLNSARPYFSRKQKPSLQERKLTLVDYRIHIMLDGLDGSLKILVICTTESFRVCCPSEYDRIFWNLTTDGRLSSVMRLRSCLYPSGYGRIWLGWSNERVIVPAYKNIRSAIPKSINLYRSDG